MNKKPLYNNQIAAKEVRLVTEDGEQLGVISKDEALAMAKEKNLDLIQVTEKVVPPVCKIGDYGKFIYSQQKKERKMGGEKKHSGELKMIRLTYNISDNDIETRVAVAEKFLLKGGKIKIDLILRGRQNASALSDFGKQKINKLIDSLGKKLEIKIEKPLSKEPKGLSMIISKK
ncbi:MAG: translation initiation factor IF-3 [Candidatus Pacebacteria bacterium]|nr:translation initiation factor IF-3 [Candidatus Paceibacterota bacterium]